MTAGSFTTEDVRRITSQATECLLKGMVDQKTCNEILRAARRLLGALKKDLRDPGSADADAIATDVGELRKADRNAGGVAQHGACISSGDRG